MTTVLLRVKGNKCRWKQSGLSKLSLLYTPPVKSSSITFIKKKNNTATVDQRIVLIAYKPANPFPDLQTGCIHTLFKNG